MLKAREGIHFNRGEDKTMETLKAKFNSYCPVQNVPYDQNPFYTCVERAGRSPPPSRPVGRLDCEKNYLKEKTQWGFGQSHTGVL